MAKPMLAELEGRRKEQRPIRWLFTAHDRSRQEGNKVDNRELEAAVTRPMGARFTRSSTVSDHNARN